MPAPNRSQHHVHVLFRSLFSLDTGADIQSLWVTAWCGSEHHQHRHRSLARPDHDSRGGAFSGDARLSAPSSPATPPPLHLAQPPRQPYRIPCGSQSSHRLIGDTPTDGMCGVCFLAAAHLRSISNLFVDLYLGLPAQIYYGTLISCSKYGLFFYRT